MTSLKKLPLVIIYCFSFYYFKCSTLFLIGLLINLICLLWRNSAFYTCSFSLMIIGVSAWNVNWLGSAAVRILVGSSLPAFLHILFIFYFLIFFSFVFYKLFINHVFFKL